MDKLKLTGGARIGGANATFPFATLSVNNGLLKLNAGIIGSLVFQAKDIVSFEAISKFGSRGLKINHRVQSYKDNVIFWTSLEGNALIQRIHATGFIENDFNKKVENEEEIIEKQNSGGFPIKKSVAIGLVVIWNALFLWSFFDFQKGNPSGFFRNFGITTALSMMLGFSVLCLVSKKFAELVLKKGRTVKDVQSSLYLLIFVAGMMLLMYRAIPPH